MNEEIAKLYHSCVCQSNGEWEKLVYVNLSPEKLRNFIRFIAVFGVSLRCDQGAVDQLEHMLSTEPNFATWKAKNAETAGQGLERGMLYLFLRVNKDAGNVDEEIKKLLLRARIAKK